MTMSKVSDFLDHLGAVLLTDEAKLLLPAVTHYTQSLQEDPSLINLAVQNLAFQNSVLALGPQAASAAIRDTAAAIQTVVVTQLPALIAATAADLAAAGSPITPSEPAPQEPAAPAAG